MVLSPGELRLVEKRALMDCVNGLEEFIDERLAASCGGNYIQVDVDRFDVSPLVLGELRSRYYSWGLLFVDRSVLVFCDLGT